MQIDREQAKRILDLIREVEAHSMMEEDDQVLRIQIFLEFPDLMEERRP